MLNLMTPLEIFLTFYAVVMTIFALVVVLAPGKVTDPRIDATRRQIEEDVYHV